MASNQYNSDTANRAMTKTGQELSLAAEHEWQQHNTISTHCIHGQGHIATVIDSRPLDIQLSLMRWYSGMLHVASLL